jgi:hypothetical protein
MPTGQKGRNMPQEYKDYVFANGGIEGQVTPTFIAQPGALTTAGLAVVTAQITTQTNTNTTGSYGLSSVVNASQILAVVGPIYNSPGGILNKQNGTVNTGGGP